MTDAIEVLDGGQRLPFSFGELMRYAGPGSPAGVAMAFKAMARAFPVLDPEGPPQRRQIVIETAFRGPGARDGFELVTRGLTEGRYLVTAGLERPARGATLEQFVFRFVYRQRGVTLLVREGLVTDEFIALARRDDRSAEDERRFTRLKAVTADRVMASSAEQVFELEPG